MLAGCADDAAPPERPDATTTSEALDRAAIASGQLPDPSAPVTGSYVADTDIGSDRLCMVAGGEGEPMRVGLSVSYGTGGVCVGRGTATGTARRLKVRLGEDCAFTGRVKAEGLAIPGSLPAGCKALCSGRASLAGVTVPKGSDSDTEALALVDVEGAPLCPAQIDVYVNVR